MTVLARDSVATDHLVYAWPFPIGPECEVACADDEQVVMCPAWTVGEQLGPGRHRWRTPDPSRPVAAFFVLTAPVEVSFDMVTTFTIPSTGQAVRLHAQGSLQVRCGDPGLLIAQFVGLPFDSVNEGVLRSVSRSVERMLARLLTRRVVLAGTPQAVTDPAMLANVVEELIAYNPAAGAVFGVELIRMGHISITADDGNAWPNGSQPPANNDWAADPSSETGRIPANRRYGSQPQAEPTPRASTQPAGDSRLTPRHHSAPPVPPEAPPPAPRAQSNPPTQASGEIIVRGKSPLAPPEPPAAPQRIPTTPPPESRRAGAIEVPAGTESAVMAIAGVLENISNKPMPRPPAQSEPEPESDEPRGSIMGIGMGSIGSSGIGVSTIGSGSSVAGEIPSKVAPGARVLVPGPNGLMQSATVVQLLQGYYELEVGGSGETIWVPIGGVVPE